MITWIHRVLLTTKNTFHIACVEQVHQFFCMNVMVRIQNCVFECTSKDKQPTPPCPPYRPQTVGGKSKIRYVGGMCRRNTFYYTPSTLRSTATRNVNHGKEKGATVKLIHDHIYLWLFIAAKDTSDPDSLSKITRRKTRFGHLTVIDDELFSMIVKYEVLYSYLCTSNICEWKLSLFCEVFDKTVTELFACQQLSIPSDN